MPLWESSKLLEQDLVAQTYNPSIWKVETRAPGVQGYPGLQRDFESNLGYVRPYLKKQNKTGQRRGGDEAQLTAICLARA